MVDTATFSKVQIDLVRSEIECLTILNNHPNIVKLYNYYETSRSFYMCMEMVRGGELFDRIIKKNHYSEKDARDVIIIILKTVKFCHDHKIVHRDIKAENLLMVSDADDAAVKLCDFGFAVKAEGISIKGEVGTKDYMAPEIFAGPDSLYGAPVDMWAVGVLSYIILSGYPPFHDDNRARLRAKVMKGNYKFHDEYWDNASNQAKDFVSGLLEVDMKERMTADEALDHPWVSLLHLLLY